MSIFKNLMLASAAGVMMVGAASAADLGAKKPTAVEYVRTCPTYGAGFFVVPGTTSCLKLIGRVRSEYFFDNPRGRNNNHNRFRTRGYVGFDHRTATEYGLLRTYMRAFFQRQNGNDTTVVEYAFMQFGGLTFGRFHSFVEHEFNFNFAGSDDFGGFSDMKYTNGLAYTFAAGNFSATIAAEDGSDRQNGHRITAGAGAPLNSANFAGKAMPDIVARLEYKDNWGTLIAAGAINQTRSTNAIVDTAYGYAGILAARINLPMLSRGSYLWASGGYAHGASSYLGFNRSIEIGSFNLNSSNAVVVGNSLKLSTAYAVAGGLRAFVTPTVYVGPSVSYASIDPTGPTNQLRTFKATFTAGWNPVPGFLIGAEIGWQKLWAPAPLRVPAAGQGNETNNTFGRIRIQRDF